MQSIPYANIAFNHEIVCSICIENFKDNDEVIQLRCHDKHIFHKVCITGWVRAARAECPLCKTKITLN